MTGRVLLSESGCVSQLHTPAIEAFALPQLDAAPMRRVTAEVSERAVIARQPHALARQPCVSTTTALGLQFAVLLVDIPSISIIRLDAASSRCFLIAA